ncbi:MAG: FAD-dependent oxidoreductase [Anaerolineae bacterium]|nr:FAD-dependent oxidoreductase [Anaerolineae bacterium]
MAKPIILMVDDDAEVLAAVERDLRRQYGGQYRLVQSSSGAQALDSLQKLKLRNDTVALIISDQRMPEMTGVEFLKRALDIYPLTKRVLLTAYADTDAAIHAINTVRIDYYLMKPWDPPQERLYPILDDLLGNWIDSYRPPFEGVRVIGHQWSSSSHQIKDFLARNQIPYQWLDLEKNADASKLLSMIEGKPEASLPVVLFADGSSLLTPTTQQVAAKLGLKTRAEQRFYDLAIVGGGPAGLAAAVYGASEGLHTVMIENTAPGGQAGTSSYIENYLGFPVGLSGADLAHRAVTQARRFGVEILSPQEAKELHIRDSFRVLKLADDSEIYCHALVISTGVAYRKLNIPGIEKLSGSGVYYGAAMTEALNCAGDDVYVVGGANSAGQAALHFCKYARRVIMLVRGEGLSATMSYYLIERINQTDNIEIVSCTEVAEVIGEDRLEQLRLRNNRTGEERIVESSRLFIFIGAAPCTQWLPDVIHRDANNFILTGSDLQTNGKNPKGWDLDRPPYLLETSVPGVFAAGDVRHQSVKRVASAVGEGSIAIQFVHQYLATL